MRRIAIGVALAIAFAAGAGLEARRQAYTAYGAGIESCGKWLEYRKSDNWYTNGQWVLGWVSAAGYYGSSLRKTDSAAISSWIDNYCAANPLEDLDTASRALVVALRAQ